MASVNVAELRAHARAGANVSDADLQDCIDTAVELVMGYIGDAEVAETRIDRSVLLVANECLQQNMAPNGILNQQYDDGDGSAPLRIGRDPMTPAYPLLPPLGFS